MFGLVLSLRYGYVRWATIRIFKENFAQVRKVQIVTHNITHIYYVGNQRPLYYTSEGGSCSGCFPHIHVIYR